MEEEGAPTTAGLRKNYPFCPGLCRLGNHLCIVDNGRDYGTMQVFYEITFNICQQIVDQEIKDSREPERQKGPN